MKYTTLEIPYEQKLRIDRLIRILNESGRPTSAMELVTFALAKTVNDMYEELENDEVPDTDVYAGSIASGSETVTLES